MNKEKINIIIVISLILTIGLSAGYAVGYFRATKNNFPEIKFTDEINQGITTIKLMEVKNGKLIGEVTGDNARIAYSPADIIDLKIGDKFEIPINNISLQKYYQEESIPSDTLFIASKNGKYYYPIFDKRALGIAMKNRVYFSKSSDAEKMGYLKK
jgi:uncharacterized protein YneF (UPF0154 family)